MSKELFNSPDCRKVANFIQNNRHSTKDEIHQFINEHGMSMSAFYDLLAANIIEERNGEFYVVNSD